MTIVSARFHDSWSAGQVRVQVRLLYAQGCKQFPGILGSAKLMLPSHQLQDIFTVHPNTGSNTHDLLECLCGGTNSPKSMHRFDEDSEEDEAEEDEDVRMGFVNASEVQPEHTEKMDKAVSRTQSPFIRDDAHSEI